MVNKAPNARALGCVEYGLAMFKNLHLWANIMLGMVLAILMAVGAQGYGSLLSLERVIMAAERTRLSEDMTSLQAAIAADTRQAEALSALVANIPEVQERFAAGDRAWLQANLLPAYQVLAKHYGAVQFQFLTPPATSFLRLHLLEKFGDDLSAIRKTVMDTNRTLAPQRGLEVGVAGLGARGMVPIFAGDQHLGVVEFGMSFGKPFFENFKATFGVDAGLYLANGDKFTTFATTLGESHLLDPARLRAVLAGEPQLVEIEHEGRPLLVYAALLRDYSGLPLGVIELSTDHSEADAILTAASRQSWLIGGLALLLSLLIAQVTARSLGRRIRLLSAGVERVAAGDLSREIPSAGRDEIAGLARAADTMRRHLHQLVAEVEANATAVHHSAQEIARAVDGQAANSTQMSASVAEITSTMEELSASSSQIAEYSESVVTVARQTLEDSHTGAGAMQQLASRMEENRNDSQSALREILALGTKSKEISRIMEIIDTVADQTRLIAFNAALEAASAGEAGKRFAVVAAEIRRLADSVSESTGEIARKVAEIQESIGRLVVTSEKGTAGIEQGMTESNQVVHFLTALVDGAGETTSAAQQISLSSQQQRTASNQVVVALREIVTASADTANSVRCIAAITQDMTGRSASLKEQVDRFQLMSDAAPQGQP